jgi:hypothetical protein
LQEALFYSFNLDRHISMDHLLRSIDRFVVLMIRILIVGYCFGIRSERRLCDEVHLDLGYRWFCRLSLDAAVQDHLTFPANAERMPISCVNCHTRADHVTALERVSMAEASAASAMGTF